MSNRRPSTSASAPGAGMVPSTIAAVCGLLFALCLFLSVSTVSPVENETDDGLLAEWAQSSLRQDFVLSMTFQIVAAIAFLVFFAEIRHRLAQAAPAHPWRGLVDAASITFVGMLSVSAIVRGAVSFNVEVRDQPLPGADALRLVTAMTDVTMSLVVMPLAALTLLMTGLVMLQSGMSARWLAWMGIGVAILCLIMVLLTMGAFAVPLVLLWTVAASVHLLRSARTSQRSMRAVALDEAATPLTTHA